MEKLSGVCNLVNGTLSLFLNTMTHIFCCASDEDAASMVPSARMGRANHDLSRPGMPAACPRYASTDMADVRHSVSLCSSVVLTLCDTYE